MRRLLCSSLLFACLLSPAVWGAIDCSRAKRNVDKLICSSSDLTVAQEQMALSFRMAMRRGVDLDELRRTQQQWHDQVRNA